MIVKIVTLQTFNSNSTLTIENLICNTHCTPARYRHSSPSLTPKCMRSSYMTFIDLEKEVLLIIQSIGMNSLQALFWPPLPCHASLFFKDISSYSVVAYQSRHLSHGVQWGEVHGKGAEMWMLHLLSMSFSSVPFTDETCAWGRGWAEDLAVISARKTEWAYVCVCVCLSVCSSAKQSWGFYPGDLGHSCISLLVLSSGSWSQIIFAPSLKN